MGRLREDRDAIKIQQATGADYETARNESLRRRELGQIGIYMKGIKAQPKWQEGQTIKCVRCLAPEHGKCQV